MSSLPQEEELDFSVESAIIASNNANNNNNINSTSNNGPRELTSEEKLIRAELQQQEEERKRLEDIAEEKERKRLMNEIQHRNIHFICDHRSDVTKENLHNLDDENPNFMNYNKLYFILFVGYSHSCRAHIAQILNQTINQKFSKSYSCGIELASELDPLAIQIMKEIDIDISKQTQRSLNSVLTDNSVQFDVIIPLDERSLEACKSAQWKNKPKFLPQFFTNPKKSIENSDEATQLEAYRKLRLEIQNFVKELPEILSMLE